MFTKKISHYKKPPILSAKLLTPLRDNYECVRRNASCFFAIIARSAMATLRWLRFEDYVACRGGDAG